MIILGINPGFDAAAALVIDGELVAVVEEERLSRIKMHLGFPRRAITEALRIAGVDPADVDQVTFSFVDYLAAHPVITQLLLRDAGFPFNPETPLEPVKMLRSVLSVAREPGVLSIGTRRASGRFVEQNTAAYLRELHLLGLRVDRLTPVDHHLSHAASAYYGSGYDDCLVVTADGCGDGRSASITHVHDGRFEVIAESPEQNSAGFLYTSVTSFLGFRPHRHEGKVTGLAAYGDPERCYDKFRPCLDVTLDGSALTCEFPEGSWFDTARHLTRLPGRRYYRRPVMNLYEEHYQRHLSDDTREDIAAAVQRRLEDVIVSYVRPALQRTGVRRLALAGGVFANVKLNQRLYELAEVDEIFVQPNMGDGGNAVGSALHSAHAGRHTRPGALRDVYLGPSYDDGEIESELRSRGLAYRRTDHVEAEIAERLAAGAVVGRFAGRMEYGPRALGNRSILASPADASINDALNARLHRTEFMPFAPSVTAEDARSYFELGDGDFRAAEFMTITCDVRPERRAEIPAVTHVDGTARPNVVHEHVNPSYHRTIREFKQRTGLGAIVNTSFNVHEQPIVCTPADACIAYEQGSVDTLAIGNFLVEQRAAA
jgi:carbamoyltransferase